MAAAVVIVGVDEVHERDLLGRWYWHRLASRLLLPRKLRSATVTLPPLLVHRRRALKVRPGNQ
jgi:hypothetical protein